jgi:uncharacterized protein YbjT (DUF2867 family)
MAGNGTVFLVGASGTVGKLLAAELLANERCTKLVLLARRPTGLSAPKIEERVINFEAPTTWAPMKGDVLFSALGSTLRAAGSEAALFKIDHDTQLRVAAHAARGGGVPTCVLVSSNAANLRSPTFYGRMKAEIERDLAELPFKNLIILRPGIIEGGEQVEERAASVAVDAAFRPLPGGIFAKAAVAAAHLASDRPRRIYGPGDLLKLAGVVSVGESGIRGITEG